MVSKLTRYLKLEKEVSEILRLNNIVNIFYWNSSIVNPKFYKINQEPEISLIKQIYHDRFRSKKVKRLISEAKLDEQGMNEWQTKNLHLIERNHLFASCISKKLYKEHQNNIFQSESVFSNATDYKEISQCLDNIVKTTREIAQIKSDLQGTNLYDALIDNYDPGRKFSFVLQIINGLKKPLKQLRQRLIDNDLSSRTASFRNTLTRDQKKFFYRKVLTKLGFDII